MSCLKKILGIYIAFLLQSIIFENIKIFSCSPDVLIVAIIICSVSSGVLQAAILGGSAGLLMDVLIGNMFGLNTLLYMYVGFFVSTAVNEKTANSPLLMGWVTFISVTVLEIALTLFKTLFGYETSLGFLGTNILVKGLFGAVFSLLFVLVCQKVKSRRAKKTDKAEEVSA